MAAGRLLLTLTFIAMGLLAAALALSAGGGAPIGQLTSLSGWLPAVNVSGMPAPPARSDGFTLLIGFQAGWWLRWLYGLPWSALPRAIGEWLLGWRASAAMAGLAVGCTVILLFY